MFGWPQGLGAAGAVLALSGCVLPLSITVADDDVHVRGSGRLVTVTRQVHDFDAVSAHGVARVVIERTGRLGVSITAEDNLVPYLIAEVRDGVLDVGVRSGVDMRPTRDIVVWIESGELVELAGSGAAEASGASFVRYLGSPWVQAHVSGASAVTRY